MLVGQQSESGDTRAGVHLSGRGILRLQEDRAQLGRGARSQVHGRIDLVDAARFAAVHD